MTVPSERASSELQATDGTRRSWAYDFTASSADELELYLIDGAGVETLVDPTAWRAEEPFDQAEGGTITWPVSGLAQASGYSVRVDRRPPFTQAVGLGGRYHPDVVERMIDRGVKQTTWLLMERGRLMARVAALAVAVAQLQAGGGGGGGGGGTTTPVAVPFITSAFLGLKGDGSTDDVRLVQNKIDDLATIGRGGYLLLDAPGGVALRFNDQLRVHGGVTVAFTSVQRYGNLGGVAIAGSWKRQGGAGLRLAADVANGAGSFALDTATAGGGVASNYLTVGDRVGFAGNRGSAGTPHKVFDTWVTAIDDVTGTVSVSPSFDRSFSMAWGSSGWTASGESDLTTIERRVTARLSSSLLLPSNAVLVDADDVALLSVGDWVVAEDDAICSDLVGSSTGRVNRVTAQVRDIDGQTVLLDRPIECPLSTSKAARLTVFEPAYGVVLGASAEFVEDPDLANAPSGIFEFRHAVGSAFFDAAVMGDQEHGTPAAGIRYELSADCWFLDGEVSYPAFLDAGQGYGALGEWSSDCGAIGTVFRGCRHSFVHASGQRCKGDRLKSFDCRVSDYDWHGAGERLSGFVECEATGGSTAVGTSRSAIAFGNGTHLNGPYGGYFRGGAVSSYVDGPSDSAYVATWSAGATDCYVTHCKASNVSTVFQILNDQSNPNHPVDGAGFILCEWDGVAGYLGRLEGNKYGVPTGYPIRNFVLEVVRIRDCGKLFDFERAQGVRLLSLDIDRCTPDTDKPFILDATDCPSLSVELSTFHGVKKGFRVTNCTPASPANGKPPRFLGNHLLELTDPAGLVLDDTGGCNYGEWIDNRLAGIATPQMALVSTGWKIAPRSIGFRNITDDGSLVIRPPQPTGIIDLWTTSGDYTRARFICGAGGSAVVLDGDSNAGVGALDAVLGGITDGQLAVVPRTDGDLTLFNRRGGTRGVEWSFA